jgi:hypothetical protein
VAAIVAPTLLSPVIGDHVGLVIVGILSIGVISDSVDSVKSCSYVTLVSLFTVICLLLAVVVPLVSRVFREPKPDAPRYRRKKTRRDGAEAQMMPA